MTTNFVKLSASRLLKRALAPAVLLVLTTLGTGAIAHAEEIAADSTQSKASPAGPCCDIEGSWLYTVTIPGSPPYTFLGTETYAAGGGYVEADQLSFTAGSLATAGHGIWKASGGPNGYLLTYVNLTYKDGVATGSSKVRQKMTLTNGGKDYVGYGDFFYYDTDGVTVMFSGTFTITAKKIAIERPQS